MKEEFDDRKFIDDFRKKYIDLKENENGFSGLSFQISKIEENMISDFYRSSSIKHPGDKGTSRENFLRNFLSNYEYLPKKYGVSKGSSHIISSSGHKSSQIDLLLYDSLNCPKLLTLDDIQFYPVESVFGTIEVKSNLDSKRTLFDALDKIASFKKMPCNRSSVKQFGGFQMSSPATRGFGIVFSYDATLKWKTIFDYIEEYQKIKDKSEWPNLICILNQGMIVQLDNNRGVFTSDEIENSTNNSLMGAPSGYGNLLNFYLILMDLLNNSNLPAVNMRNYVSIENPSQNKSYRFTRGEFGELGNCKIHGDYLKKINDQSLQLIISECKTSEFINWIKATDIAYGNELDEEKYQKQPHNIKIYNPDKLELSDILIDKDDLLKGLLFEDIIIDEINYWIPYYYVFRDNLIEYCPKCKKK